MNKAQKSLKTKINRLKYYISELESTRSRKFRANIIMKLHIKAHKADLKELQKLLSFTGL